MSGPGPRQEGGLTVGRVSGVPVTVGWSWLAAAAVMVLAFGPRLASELGRGAGYAMAAAYGVVLLLSVFVHELAHAVVGNRKGHRSEQIVLTFLGGHTRIAGPRGRRPRNADLLMIALAGPCANIVLAAAAWLGMLALARGPETLLLSPSGTWAAQLLWAVLWANLLLGAFNLLPGVPLDGGQLVESAVWAATGRRRRGTAAAAWAGIVIGLGLVSFAVVLFLRRVDLAVAVGTALTGAFIAYAAYRQLQRVPLLAYLDSWDVFERLRPVAGVIAADAPVPAGLDRLLAVEDGGRMIGYLDPRGASGPLVSDSMLLVGAVLERDAEVADVLDAFRDEDVWAVGVVERGRCVGVLTREDLNIEARDLTERAELDTDEKDA
ncbi:site-2 protease family protein [Arthrobacter sp. UM1]|uniref:site-2 protease family protein n=1 Tax=Arthrobacter sp. UM1 TaxID=2766776 RepID=UPI001CF6EDEF|nr:site-2 protease family protein [Arthrobacter sp. UM1]MCB4207504.1 site-2 protease family protein [Arthrobacter sp. UM1]